GPPRPQIDDEGAVAHEGEGGADLAMLGEVSFERIPHRLETGRDGAVDLRLPNFHASERYCDTAARSTSSTSSTDPTNWASGGSCTHVAPNSASRSRPATVRTMSALPLSSRTAGSEHRMAIEAGSRPTFSHALATRARALTLSSVAVLPIA